MNHNSRDPNLQNIPNKGGGLIKRAYVSRFEEGVIFQADYSQIELRVAACWYRDDNMIDAYRKGVDLHALTAADMHHYSWAAFQALPAKERKEMRTRAKRLNFGCLYGGGPLALQKTLRKDGVFATLDECRAFIQQFFAARPGLKEGIRRTEDFARKHGHLISFTGRRRRIPEVRSGDEQLVARALRQAVNFPIQNGASEMTLMALVLISRLLEEGGFRSVPILTVHDSLVFDCPLDEVVEVARIAKDVMENIRDLSDYVLPGIDWSWLTVPVVADCEVGWSWGSMVEFDPEVFGTAASLPLFEKDEDGATKIARVPVDMPELRKLLDWRAA